MLVVGRLEFSISKARSAFSGKSLWKISAYIVGEYYNRSKRLPSPSHSTCRKGLFTGTLWFGLIFVWKPRRKKRWGHSRFVWRPCVTKVSKCNWSANGLHPCGIRDQPLSTAGQLIHLPHCPLGSTGRDTPECNGRKLLLLFMWLICIISWALILYGSSAL